MTRGAWIRWLLGLAISAVFVWLAFRAIDPGEVWREIVSADQRYLVPATATTILTFVLRGIRWRLCFEPEDAVNFRQASFAYGVGVLSSQFIPARLGDLVRAYVVGQASPVSKSKALGTLVVERLSDLFAVVIFLAALLPAFDLPAWIKVADGFAAGVALAALVVVYLLAQRSEDFPEPGWVAARRPLHALFRFFVQILEGFSAVKDPHRALLILLVSFALWVSQTGTYSIPFVALHMPLGWKEGALTTQVLALTAIIPTGPGFAGSFEIATQNLLAIFGVDITKATSYLEYTRIAALLAVALYALGAFVVLKLTIPRSAPALQRAPAVRSGR